MTLLSTFWFDVAGAAVFATGVIADHLSPGWPHWPARLTRTKSSKER